MRLAVIGLGPKGLYCLERLTIELLRLRPDPRPQVHVFEPHPVPGAGPVYDPTQPWFLRLNYANGNIDVWSRGPDALPGAGGTFVDFLRDRHPSLDDPAGYAPRAIVGEYLSDMASTVLRELGAVADVRLHPQTVEQIVRDGDGFLIDSADSTDRFDEILVATGHASQAGLGIDGTPGPPLGPYPLDGLAGRAGLDAAAPGSAVAVRGLGLTAIDVCLAMTEGRGGRFDGTGRAAPAHYEPSGHEPAAIVAYSRTGRPMLPKDHPRFGPVIDLEALRSSRSLDTVSGAGRPAGDVIEGIERGLLETAHEALWRATGTRASCDPSVVLPGKLRGGTSRAEPAADTLRRAVDVAYGRRPPGADWALGVAWRCHYPELVEMAAQRRLDPVRPAFDRLAAAMERLAFGPPAENGARLLALVDAGLLDLGVAAGPTVRSFGGGGRRSTVLRTATDTRCVDLVIDAVLAPAGAAAAPSSLLASLFDAGLARTVDSASGVEVTPDGTCVGASGTPTPGLAVVGRATEGCVLGNDTLSRTLHDTPTRWGRRVARRLGDRTLTGVHR